MDPSQAAPNGRSRAWFRELTRYQWWVLFLASLGWMFDTMDQQFFNLARGPAMQELLGYDGRAIGLKALGADAKTTYTAGDLHALVAAGVLTAEEQARLMSQPETAARLEAGLARRDFAPVVGRLLLERRHAERGLELLAKQPGDSFDRAGLDQLIASNAISRDFAEQALAAHPDGQVPRSFIARALGESEAKVKQGQRGDHATTIFIIGWAVGGLFFGLVGDRLGRVKTMALTILIYALFTGLSGLAQTWWQFAAFRFLTALGVGGEFAAGAALVAETMSERVRPLALGTLQALSAVGNIAAGACSYFITPAFGWRWLFAVGAVPALLAVVVRLGLREPEKWQAARARAAQEHARGKAVGSYAALFASPRWRRNAIIGMLLGVVGVAGLWGVGFFTPELIRIAVAGVTAKEREQIVAVTFMLQQLGAFFGISGYTWLSQRVGRKPAFGFFFAFAFVVTSYIFLFLDTKTEAFYLLPILGFATLGPFGGYAIYFPELFPTRLRATGTGFCYNVGRFLAAFSSSLKGWLSGVFNSGALIPILPMLNASVGNAERATRYASVTMACVYLLGLIALRFAPETKGQPLPED